MQKSHFHLNKGLCKSVILTPRSGKLQNKLQYSFPMPVVQGIGLNMLNATFRDILCLVQYMFPFISEFSPFSLSKLIELVRYILYLRVRIRVSLNMTRF